MRICAAWALSLHPWLSLACLAILSPFCFLCLGWPTVLGAELRLSVRLQPKFLCWELQETSWKGWIWTPTKLPSCWLLEGWNFRPRRYKRQFTDALIVGLSLSAGDLPEAAGINMQMLLPHHLQLLSILVSICDFNQFFPPLPVELKALLTIWRDCEMAL